MLFAVYVCTINTNGVLVLQDVYSRDLLGGQYMPKISISACASPRLQSFLEVPPLPRSLVDGQGPLWLCERTIRLVLLFGQHPLMMLLFDEPV